MSAPRFVVERRDARRWAVIDTAARPGSVWRVRNEYATRRDARLEAGRLNAERPRTTPKETP